ncbi:pyridoxal phosphate-dependent aminotransferase [Marisediminicola senii]|uniref:pyridoxal phosphate-dependent aminotransferase n=1 Tax=Marisediminicola senii TaxID=2711233 RepID=UPI0013EC9FDF|nr:aminotransferase class I/II-fold pyridoxal phosphate-dependent enzyme [Marisediminicola senii]
MPSLAPHTASVPPSGIRRIFDLAGELDDVIALAIGEPDVPVAEHILAAGARAFMADVTDYTPNGGIPQLRQAIVEKLARENSLTVDLEQVWVTVGATQALHQAMGLLLDAGDEILVPDPGYTTFSMSARMAGATPVPYSLRPDSGFAPSIDELDRLVTDRTRVIIVNTPSNPLGSVLDADQLRELLAFARRHDLWVLSDEVYEYFTYGTPHVSIASLDDDDRVFSAFSLSKTYAMTGVRVGYLVTPPGMAPIMRTVQEASISCVTSPAQLAAIAAITGDHQHVADAREHYRGNLEAACAVLDERGIHYLRPNGAFYLWIDMQHATQGDVAGWTEAFLLRERVSVAPGSAFGRAGEGWIRVCVAADRADVIEGLRRLPAPHGTIA